VIVYPERRLRRAHLQPIPHAISKPCFHLHAPFCAHTRRSMLAQPMRSAASLRFPGVATGTDHVSRLFVAPLFSYSDELLFPQFLYFDNHPHCLGVWFLSAFSGHSFTQSALCEGPLVAAHSPSLTPLAATHTKLPSASPFLATHPKNRGVSASDIVNSKFPTHLTTATMQRTICAQ